MKYHPSYHSPILAIYEARPPYGALNAMSPGAAAARFERVYFVCILAIYFVGAGRCSNNNQTRHLVLKGSS